MSATPVFSGFALSHAIERSDVAGNSNIFMCVCVCSHCVCVCVGRDVTRQLQRLLRRAGHALCTTSEVEVVRDIKETLCYVAVEPTRAESSPESASYRLPDGRVLELGADRFRAPELLFRPSLCGSEALGAGECVSVAVRRADLELRRELWANVLLSGGSTLFGGFGERLLREVKDGAGDVQIRIAAPKERRLSTWMGGSILAALGTFKDMWVTRDEYVEEGASVVHRFF